jgi:hypothetical protein
MKSNILLLLMTLILVAGACTRDPESYTKQKSTDLVIPGDFDWKTSRDVQVNIDGLDLPVEFYSTLKIADPEGQTLFTANYNLQSDLSFTLTVPATLDSIILTYGSRTMKGAIEKGKVDFTFLQKDDKSDLGK